jgi:PKD repeat protein
VTHSYNAAGSYQVTLTVTDDGDLSDSATQTVQVDQPNLPPKAIISGPTSGLVGETLSFSGANSSDDDGRIVSYAWDFGDGTTGSGLNVTHSYSTDGSYTVTLTVTDNGGLTGKATHAVQVNQPVQINLPPTAVIEGPVTAQVSQTIQFDGSGSSDSDGNIVSYAWDVGDGTTGSGITVTHVYTQAGNYKVALTVTDNGGLTGKATHTVQIDQPAQINPPPIAMRALAAVQVSLPSNSTRQKGV